MNAYELAKILETNKFLNPNHTKEMCNMLLQQATEKAESENRVKELERRLERYQMALEYWKNKAEYLDKRELELLAEIASLEKSLHMIQRHYDLLGTFSPSGNNAQDVGNTNETLPKGKV